MGAEEEEDGVEKEGETDRQWCVCMCMFTVNHCSAIHIINVDRLERKGQQEEGEAA